MDINPKLNDIKDCLYRVSVKAVIINDGKLLLVKDKDDKDWSLPGGGVDLGEDLPTALKRELAEELGLSESNITSDYEIKSVIIGHVKDGIPRCNIHFLVHLNTQKLKPTSELASLEWVAIDDLNSINFDPTAGPKNEVLYLINKLA